MKKISRHFFEKTKMQKLPFQIPNLRHVFRRRGDAKTSIPDTKSPTRPSWTRRRNCGNSETEKETFSPPKSHVRFRTCTTAGSITKWKAWMMVGSYLRFEMEGMDDGGELFEI
jgi:hypothetical protein